MKMWVFSKPYIIKKVNVNSWYMLHLIALDIGSLKTLLPGLWVSFSISHYNLLNS